MGVESLTPDQQHRVSEVIRGALFGVLLGMQTRGLVCFQAQDCRTMADFAERDGIGPMPGQEWSHEDRMMAPIYRDEYVRTFRELAKGLELTGCHFRPREIHILSAIIADRNLALEPVTSDDVAEIWGHA